MPKRTEQQVLSFAADAATAIKANGLALPQLWSHASHHHHHHTHISAICTGGSRPYQTAVELQRPSFQCNCPSRKRPCKHAIGLYLLYLRNPELFASVAHVPQWVTLRTHSGMDIPTSFSQLGYLEKAWANSDRMDRMRQGANELLRWLEDVMRLGLGALGRQPEGYWEQVSESMTNYQLPGLKTYISPMMRHRAAHNQWVPDMLHSLSEMYFLLQAFLRLSDHSEPMQASILQYLGVNARVADLSEVELHSAAWQHLASCEGIRDNIRFRRNWWGDTADGTYAVEMQYAYGNASLPDPYRIGDIHPMLAYRYPGLGVSRIAFSQQAAVIPHTICPISGLSISKLDQYLVNQVADDPFVQLIPVLLTGVVPHISNQVAYLTDGVQLGIKITNTHFWKIMALSGGEPLGVFGEWGEGIFRPLSTLRYNKWLLL